MKKCCFLMALIIRVIFIEAADAIFNKVWLEHDVMSNGKNGLNIHADFNVNGMKDKKIQVIACFYDENKNSHFGNAQGYKTTSNTVCVYEEAEPIYINSRYKDYPLFIPYDALCLKEGNHKYYCRVIIRDVENDYHCISDWSQYVSFVGTGPKKSGGNNNDNNVPGKTIRYYGEGGIMFMGSSNSTLEVSGYVDVYYGSDGKAYAYSVDGGTRRTLEYIKKNEYKTNDDKSECRLAIDEKGQYINLVYYNNFMGISSITINCYTLTAVQHNGNNMRGGPMIIGGNPGVMPRGESSGGSVYTKCKTCGGSGICQSCGGRGGEWRDTGGFTGSNTKSWIKCPSCRGNGKCYMCHGSGRY